MSKIEIDEVKKKLVGMWKLVSVSMKDLNGKPLGKFESKGRLVYDERGYMAVQIMGIDRPQFKSGRQDVGTDGEFKQAFIYSTAYYGTYEINEEKGIVTHRIESSLFPNWEGTAQERNFILLEDRLDLVALIPEEETEYIVSWKRL